LLLAIKKSVDEDRLAGCMETLTLPFQAGFTTGHKSGQNAGKNDPG
jgi:hypothetical protein